MAAGALGLALGLLSTTPVVEDTSRHSTMIVPGFLFASGSQGKDFGVEISAVHWPDRNEALLFGAYGQAEMGTRAPRLSAGVEAGFSVFGVELGWMRRFEGDGLAAAHGVQVTPYLSLGLLNLGVRVTETSAREGAWGSEVAFVLSIKSWLVVSGKEPDPIKINLPHGRPLRDDAGRAIDAPTARCASRDPAVAHWIARGESEQISVATFVRLRAELAAHGAPDALLAACTEAALDEVAHARACFAMAERIGSAPVIPGDLAIPAPRAIGLTELAIEALRDGCVGEGRAADAIAAEGLLPTVADEERQHAELGFAIVAFALERGGAPVAEALAAEIPAVPSRVAARVLAMRSRHAGRD